jgi:hypothetical protein
MSWYWLCATCRCRLPPAPRSLRCGRAHTRSSAHRAFSHRRRRSSASRSKGRPRGLREVLAAPVLARFVIVTRLEALAQALRALPPHPGTPATSRTESRKPLRNGCGCPAARAAAPLACQHRSRSSGYHKVAVRLTCATLRYAARKSSSDTACTGSPTVAQVVEHAALEVDERARQHRTVRTLKCLQASWGVAPMEGLDLGQP